MGQPISDNHESTGKFFSSTEGVWKEHDTIMNSMINAECTISAQQFPSALMTLSYCQNGSFAKIIQSEKNVDFCSSK